MRKLKIICEIGVNHNGDVGLAREMVAAAAECGADYVKFQIFDPDAIVTKTAHRAAYQKRNTGSDKSQQEMLNALTLSHTEFETLVAHCETCKTKFLASVFDPPSLDFLVNGLGQKLVKFGSGEISNLPLLFTAARAGTDLIISTGTATISDIERALALLAFAYAGTDDPQPDLANVWQAWSDADSRALAKERVAILHCTSDYPPLDEDINLSAMTSIERCFGFPVGFSDHTTGSLASILAVAHGAQWIEKHFTTDRTLKGPDQAASMEPAQFKALVNDLRNIPVLMGDGIKVPSQRERQNAALVRKSLIANTQIAQGAVFTPANVVLKRPGTGRPPEDYWALLGTKAARAYAPDDLID